MASDVTVGDDPEESSYAPVPRAGDVARFAAAVPFYLAFARKVGGPVLALGRETSPVTVPLVRAGFEVTCLVPTADHDVANVAGVRDIATFVGVSRIDADPGTFTLDTSFRLVIVPGRVVRRLRSPADRLAMLARLRRHVAPGGRVVFEVARRPTDSPGSVTPEAMAKLLETAGFDMTARYGDGEFGPVTPASTTILLVCKSSAGAVGPVTPS